MNARFAPTDEQVTAVELFRSGDDLAIEAGAGTGKTSTLQLIAGDTRRHGQYLAFNRAIVEESRAKMPANVKAHTAHSLAYRAVGYKHRDRMAQPRMRSSDIADRLAIRGIQLDVDGNTKWLPPMFLAGQVMAAVTRFCQSADPEPSARHAQWIDGIDAADPTGRCRHNNDRVAAELVPYVAKAWADLQSDSGVLPYRHDHYLKQWELSAPRIPAEFVLFDECQDANPVMLSIVDQQTDAQKVFVGDSQQQLYAFTGAVNAMERIDAKRCWLTRSFRFGPAVAAVANDVLELLGAELRITGSAVDTHVWPVEHPDVILSRTNAVAVQELMGLQSEGRRPHLVGGGQDVISFAKAAKDLREFGRTTHPELACFDSWAEVCDYVTHDPHGSDLRLLVDLVCRFGPGRIMAALLNMPDEGSADVVLSTAHKAKGREWPTVRLAADFPGPDPATGVLPPADELRLLYVAVTRARRGLDPFACEMFPQVGERS